RTDCPDDFINKSGIVRRINGHRVADFEAQSPAAEIDLEMACILFRFRAAQTPINDQFAGKRIAPRVRRSGRGWFGWSTNFWHNVLIECWSNGVGRNNAISDQLFITPGLQRSITPLIDIALIAFITL